MSVFPVSVKNNNVLLTIKRLLKYTEHMSRQDAATDVFTAIADPTRRTILQTLGGGEQPVSALAAQFEVSLSAISQHIRILREAGLVTARKSGRERLYHLNPVALKPVAEWIAFYEPFWSDKLDALETYLDEQEQNERQEQNEPK